MNELERLKQDIPRYSNEYAEGSPALKNLLVKLWSNDVETVGCCAGHEKQEVYYKLNLRGNADSIDKETYQKHRFSPFYRKIVSDHSPYIAIQTNNMEQAQKLSNSIHRELDKSFDITIHQQDSIFFSGISVSLNHYAPEPERENFFNCLSDVLERNLFPEKISTMGVKTMPGRNASLADQIGIANKKATERKIKENGINNLTRNKISESIREL